MRNEAYMFIRRSDEYCSTTKQTDFYRSRHKITPNACSQDIRKNVKDDRLFGVGLTY